jgi:hypothetical protein
MNAIVTVTIPSTVVFVVGFGLATVGLQTIAKVSEATTKVVQASYVGAAAGDVDPRRQEVTF